MVVEHYLQNVMFCIWVVYVFIPLLDFILPLDEYNLSPASLSIFEKDTRFLIPLYTVWILDFGLYFYSLYLLTIPGRFTEQPLYFLLTCFIISHSGSLNMVGGHELVHKRSIFHKTIGNLAYAKFMYPHFLIQHVKSHHKKVATPEDPSTARRGESVYYFYWRAIPQGYVETWDLEKERLVKEGVSPFSLKNKLIQWNLMCVTYLTFLWTFLGNRALLFHTLYSISGILLFEAINYIEHYGLERKLDANGNYESISIKHSWNAP